MERKQSQERWFQIKHGKCGATFTIGIEGYLESEIKYPPYIRCPNCREKIIADLNFTDFVNFLRNYKKLIKSFEKAGSSINEIQYEALDTK